MSHFVTTLKEVLNICVLRLAGGLECLSEHALCCFADQLYNWNLEVTLIPQLFYGSPAGGTAEELPLDSYLAGYRQLKDSAPKVPSQSGCLGIREQVLMELRDQPVTKCADQALAMLGLERNYTELPGPFCCTASQTVSGGQSKADSTKTRMVPLLLVGSGQSSQGTLYLPISCNPPW